MLIRNATLADDRVRDVAIDGERIVAVGEDLGEHPTREDSTGETIDASGKRLLPGMIDTHVHCRDLDASHKETWASASRAAAAGGVTTIVDQPNTEPPTIDGAGFDQKAERAAVSHVEYGINGGVTPVWRPEELFERPLFALGEVFLADSTGEMGIDEDLFADALARASEAGVPVTVHAENAARFETAARERCAGAQGDADAWSAYRPAAAEITAIKRAIEIAREVETKLHVAHTSTPEGIDAASEAGMTCEVTPHHLLLSRDDLDELGTLGRMNPPLRSEQRRSGLYDRVADGTVSMIATDHAPHTRAEKDTDIWEAPSGVPGVETALPLLLAEAKAGRLSYERVRELTASAPAAVFDLPRKGRIEAGTDADLVLVDPRSTREIRAGSLHSKADWTPFEGWEGVFPEWTMVRGTVVYERDGNGERNQNDDGSEAEERFGDPIGRNVRE